MALTVKKRREIMRAVTNAFMCVCAVNYYYYYHTRTREMYENNAVFGCWVGFVGWG